MYLDLNTFTCLRSFRSILIVAVCRYFNEKVNNLIRNFIQRRNLISCSIFWSALQPRIWDNTDILSSSIAYSFKLPSQNCSGSWLAYWVKLWLYITLKKLRIDGWKMYMDIVATHENCQILSLKLWSVHINSITTRS